MTPEPLMQVRGLRKAYAPSHWWRKRLPFLALDNVDLAIQTGQTLALVGESGCEQVAVVLVSGVPPRCDRSKSGTCSARPDLRK